ncbi:MAG TPA: hypothetical protein VKB50_31115 [Vicinamibacterales bacterium]|nr:hypothetical protein [Vicinamibacterales bacterium]
MDLILKLEQREEILRAVRAIERQLMSVHDTPSTRAISMISTNPAAIRMKLSDPLPGSSN